MAASVELKINRSLLDPNFDGYKLSLDKLSTYRSALDEEIGEVKLSDDQYSYQHVKAFGVHNHLVVDPWDPDTVYFIDKSWRVFAQRVILETSLSPPAEVFIIPDHANKQHQPGRHNPTLSFPSSHWALLADGAGHFFILATGDRKDQEKWTGSYSETCLGEGKPFTILHSTVQTDNESHRMDCLLLHVDPLPESETSDESNKSLFVTVLEWLTFVTAVTNGNWSRERTRRLTGNRSPDHAALETNGRAVNISAERPFKMVYDSAKPVEEPKEQDTTEEPPPTYTWQQTDEEITVQFTLPESVSKSDIAFHLTPGGIELGIKNGENLLHGELQYDVDVEGSTWTLEANRLELTLLKKDSTAWHLVVCGDTRGRMVLDPNEVKLIHERLAHLTSDRFNPDPEEGQKPAYNAQQLEDCDLYPDDNSTMFRIDGETHQATHLVHLGSNQWLFNTNLIAGKPPAICFRHDVDGLLWQPTMDADSACPWEHKATFHAFGYVQASKINKKFAGCASDFSYCFVADCSRHIYIYRRPDDILSPLRNRKTGRTVTAVAKQQVVSLDNADDIHGIAATPERLYVLSGKTLYVVRAKMDQ